MNERKKMPTFYLDLGLLYSWYKIFPWSNFKIPKRELNEYNKCSKIHSIVVVFSLLLLLLFVCVC